MKRISRLAVGVTGAVALVATSLSPAHAALSPTPARSWSVNGTVYAEVIVGDNLIIGGSFTTATSPTGDAVHRANLAAISMTTGNLVTGFVSNTNGAVRALATDGTSVWVGGTFTTVQAQTHRRIAKITPGTGTPYASFTGGTNGAVRALSTDGTNLYVGGRFDTVNAVDQPRIARVAASTGTLDTAFAASTNGAVYALGRIGNSGVLYVGGDFNSLSGVGRLGVGAVNANTGAVTGAAFSGSLRPVLGLSVNGSETAVYGALGGAGNRAIAWSVASRGQYWHVTTAGDVQAVLFYGGLTYIGFHDGYANNTSLKLIVANAGTGAVSTTFRPTFDTFFGVEALAESPSGLAAGGDFTTVNGVPADGVARFPGQ